MAVNQLQSEIWPALPLDAWSDTCATLHLWTQIVGKIRLACAPMVNHWWQAPLYVTWNGLSTSLIPHGVRAFHIDFDFCRHELQIGTSDGSNVAFPLEPMPVSRFYSKTMAALKELGLDVAIWPVPVEVETAIPFEDDDIHAAYDPEYAARFWRALLQVDRIFKVFRARFIGKASPAHFFWGAFDFAVTRFSGRTAPPHPGGIPNVGDYVMREAYSHEVSSAGFWPGIGLGEAAFYAYAYPEPDGFPQYPVEPQAAYYHEDLREFILPYETVRKAQKPEAMLLAFLQSTYEAAADLGEWDRAALEQAAE